MTTRFFSVAWCVAFIAVSLAACQAHPNDEATRALTPADVSDYLAVRGTALKSATELAADCVAGRPATAVSAEAPPPASPTHPPVPGELTIEGARARGYDALDEEWFTASEFLAVVDSELPDDDDAGTNDAQTVKMRYGGSEMTAQFGPCARAGLEGEFGSLKDGAWHLFVLNYLFSSTDDARLEQVLSDVIPTWSMCMHREGFDFDSPRAAWQTASSEPSRELDIALADATCRDESGLNDKIRESVLRDATALVNSDSAASHNVQKVLENGGH